MITSLAVYATRPGDNISLRYFTATQHTLSARESMYTVPKQQQFWSFTFTVYF